MEKKIMIASALAATTALVGLAFLGAQVPAQQALATNGLTLTVNSANGIPSTASDSGTTYTWDTATSGGYHTSWSATGANYVSGHMLHIALNGGEFHNTVTLHQITKVTATGTETGSSSPSLILFTSTDGTTWAQTSQALDSGVAQTFDASANVGYLKFQYSRVSGATENYVDTVDIVYNCVA